MIERLLALVRDNASAPLQRSDLAGLSEAEVQSCVAEGFLKVTSLGVDDSYWHRPTGRLLTLVEGPGDSLLAVDEDDLGFAMLRVPAEDLVVWELQLPAVAARFAAANGLGGTGQMVSERLYYVGDRRNAGGVTRCCLALVCDDEQAFTTLSTLPGMFGAGAYLAVTAGFAPDLDVRLKLRGLGIEMACLDGASPWQLPLGTHLHATDGTGGRNAESGQPEFIHSDDYRSVTWRGQQFAFTPTQGAVIRLLHEAHLAGTPALSLPAIQLALPDSQATRMADVFKNTGAWQTLIVSPGRGLYQLAL